MKTRKSEIIDFIFANVKGHPRDIIPFTAKQFKVTTSAISQHISALIKEGKIEAAGKGRNRSFTLKKESYVFIEDINPAVEEDLIWNKQIKPILPPLPPNVEGICHYGFTEIFNNVIDHSASEDARVQVEFDVAEIKMTITDSGIGIFRKLKNEFNLADERQAILELSKGKLTTDPSRHSGEGIFFTSRVFDEFSIWSGELFFSHRAEKADWLITANEASRGTAVSMTIARNSNRTLQSVFHIYAGETEDYAFNKTVVALDLARFEGEQLVSRSQAKRIINRAEKFKSVLLDFAKIEFVGRAFIDEIFRVYKNEHPNVLITYINANKDIAGLIDRVASGVE
jgi:hypothetical protein